MSMFWVVLVGVVGGLAGALQGQFLGLMEDKVGTLASTFITYGVGGVVITVLMFTVGGARFSDFRGIPWWAFTAGLMGLVIVSSIGVTVANLSLGAGLTLFTAASLVIGAIVDNFGWFGEIRDLDPRRLVGIAVVIVGTWLVVGGDSTTAS